jgi:hypothetical protein
MPKTELSEPLEMDITIDELLEDDTEVVDTELVETTKKTTPKTTKKTAKNETEDLKEFLVIVQRAMMEQTNILKKIADTIEKNNVATKDNITYEQTVADVKMTPPEQFKKEEPVKYERLTKELDRILKGILPNDPNGVDILPDGRQRVAELLKGQKVKSFKDLEEKSYPEVLKLLKAIK